MRAGEGPRVLGKSPVDPLLLVARETFPVRVGKGTIFTRVEPTKVQSQPFTATVSRKASDVFTEGVW